MAGPPIEFGRRRPQALPDVAPQPKRSGHVALLVMGTIAVGGAAYVMQRQNCQQSPPGMSAAAPGGAAPATGMAVPNQPQANCSSRGSSSGGGSGYSRTRYGFFGGGSSGGASGGNATSGGVTRGGFGSFAHAFGFGGSS